MLKLKDLHCQRRNSGETAFTVLSVAEGNMKDDESSPFQRRWCIIISGFAFLGATLLFSMLAWQDLQLVTHSTKIRGVALDARGQHPMANVSLTFQHTSRFSSLHPMNLTCRREGEGNLGVESVGIQGTFYTASRDSHVDYHLLVTCPTKSLGWCADFLWDQVRRDHRTSNIVCVVSVAVRVLNVFSSNHTTAGVGFHELLDFRRDVGADKKEQEQERFEEDGRKQSLFKLSGLTWQSVQFEWNLFGSLWKDLDRVSVPVELRLPALTVQLTPDPDHPGKGPRLVTDEFQGTWGPNMVGQASSMVNEEANNNRMVFVLENEDSPFTWLLQPVVNWWTSTTESPKLEFWVHANGSFFEKFLGQHHLLQSKTTYEQKHNSRSLLQNAVNDERISNCTEWSDDSEASALLTCVESLPEGGLWIHLNFTWYTQEQLALTTELDWSNSSRVLILPNETNFTWNDDEYEFGGDDEIYDGNDEYDFEANFTMLDDYQGEGGYGDEGGDGGYGSEGGDGQYGEFGVEDNNDHENIWEFDDELEWESNYTFTFSNYSFNFGNYSYWNYTYEEDEFYDETLLVYMTTKVCLGTKKNWINSAGMLNYTFRHDQESPTIHLETEDTGSLLSHTINLSVWGEWDEQEDAKIVFHFDPMTISVGNSGMSSAAGNLSVDFDNYKASVIIENTTGKTDDYVDFKLELDSEESFEIVGSSMCNWKGQQQWAAGMSIGLQSSEIAEGQQQYMYFIKASEEISTVQASLAFDMSGVNTDVPTSVGEATQWADTDGRTKVGLTAYISKNEEDWVRTESGILWSVKNGFVEIFSRFVWGGLTWWELKVTASWEWGADVNEVLLVVSEDSLDLLARIGFEYRAEAEYVVFEFTTISLEIAKRLLFKMGASVSFNDGRQVMLEVTESRGFASSISASFESSGGRLLLLVNEGTVLIDDEIIMSISAMELLLSKEQASLSGTASMPIIGMQMDTNIDYTVESNRFTVDIDELVVQNETTTAFDMEGTAEIDVGEQTILVDIKETASDNPTFVEMVGEVVEAGDGQALDMSKIILSVGTHLFVDSNCSMGIISKDNTTITSVDIFSSDGADLQLVADMTMGGLSNNMTLSTDSVEEILGSFRIQDLRIGWDDNILVEYPSKQAVTPTAVPSMAPSTVPSRTPVPEAVVTTTVTDISVRLVGMPALTTASRRAFEISTEEFYRRQFRSKTQQGRRRVLQEVQTMSYFDTKVTVTGQQVDPQGNTILYNQTLVFATKQILEDDSPSSLEALARDILKAAFDGNESKKEFVYLLGEADEAFESAELAEVPDVPPPLADNSRDSTTDASTEGAALLAGFLLWILVSTACCLCCCILGIIAALLSMRRRSRRRKEEGSPSSAYGDLEQDAFLDESKQMYTYSHQHQSPFADETREKREMDFGDQLPVKIN